MAGYGVSVGPELLPRLLAGKDGLAKLVETVLNQVLEAQATDPLGAERYAHSEERQGYRNGDRARTLYTRVGPLTLRVPQLRDGSFATEIFHRYQRSEHAFVRRLLDGNATGPFLIGNNNIKHHLGPIRCLWVAINTARDHHLIRDERQA